MQNLCWLQWEFSLSKEWMKNQVPCLKSALESFRMKSSIWICAETMPYRSCFLMNQEGLCFQESYTVRECLHSKFWAQASLPELAWIQIMQVTYQRSSVQTSAWVVQDCYIPWVGTQLASALCSLCCAVFTTIRCASWNEAGSRRSMHRFYLIDISCQWGVTNSPLFLISVVQWSQKESWHSK